MQIHKSRILAMEVSHGYWLLNTLMNKGSELRTKNVIYVTIPKKQNLSMIFRVIWGQHMP